MVRASKQPQSPDNCNGLFSSQIQLNPVLPIKSTLFLQLNPVLPIKSTLFGFNWTRPPIGFIGQLSLFPFCHNRPIVSYGSRFAVDYLTGQRVIFCLSNLHFFFKWFLTGQLFFSFWRLFDKSLRDSLAKKSLLSLFFFDSVSSVPGKKSPELWPITPPGMQR